MELEKMEFNFQSKSTNGKTSISERPENINDISNEEFDVVVKNGGLVNIYNFNIFVRFKFFLYIFYISVRGSLTITIILNKSFLIIIF